MRGGETGASGFGAGERIVSGEPCLTPIRVQGNEKSLLEDARQGNLGQMRKKMRNSIFKKPEDINQKDARHCTPMHYAAKNSDIEMMRFIIEKGGEAGAKDKHGWSPLQYAVRYAKAESVEFLIQAGSDIHHREKKGWTSLHLAARNGQPEKARILLENGANVNDTQDQGWNPLHLAVRYGQPDTISTLLEYGIDINAHNRGWTALHLAALNGHTDIASILLNKSISTLATNQDGKTALDIAREEKHERIVAIILEYEFQANATQEVVLPTPPPTPPSAPAMDLDPSLSSHRSDLQEWRDKIKSEIQKSSTDRARSFPESEDNSEDSSLEHEPQMSWKTLEEETQELLDQLERLKMKETNQIKSKMRHIKAEHRRSLEQMEEQKILLAAKIHEEEHAIPQFEQDFLAFESNHLEAMGDIDILLANAFAESDIIEALKNNQMENRFSSSAPTKVQLIEDLETTQRKEVLELHDERRKHQGEIEGQRQEFQNHQKISEEKIKILRSEMSFLESSKMDLAKAHEQELKELQTQLEKAERRTAMKGAEGPERDEHWFGCPVCLVLLKPPMRIFQCPEGHILCEECKENPAMVHCPQCRCQLEGQCSRNRALEEVARSYYPMAPSETL
eukprot:maker-scaffold405_size181423-snap-gene-0.39 protein:Tk08185 transcript:maker-scaffold405_size181423-snap-gene-0.39-mRNA-1 annotation:"ankyrin repeat protein"